METKYYQLDWKKGATYYAHISYEENELLFCGELRGENRLHLTHTKLNNESNVPLKTGEELLQIIEHYIRMAKEKNIRYIEMSKATANLYKADHDNLLYRYDFSSITQESRDCALFLGETLKQNGWFKDLKGEFPTLAAYRKLIRDTVKKEFEIYNGRTNFRVVENHISIDIFFKDKKYNLVLKNEPSGYVASFDEEDMPFANEEELQNIVDRVLSNITKKHRLSFLYNPPREWFDVRMNEQRMPKEASNMIYEALSKEMDFESIERKSKNEGYEVKLFDYSTIKWLHFIGYTFVLNKECNYLGHFKEEEKEKIKDFSYEAIEKEVKKEYEQKILNEKMKIVLT